MRLWPMLLAPLVTAATLGAAGMWLSSAEMLHSRLSYDSLGGPAAYILYAVVVGLGVLHWLVDVLLREVRRAIDQRRNRHRARSRQPAAGHLGAPRGIYDRPVTLPPRP